MAEKGNSGLTWERQLALWLPRPLLFGAFLVAACLCVIYLIFQWYFPPAINPMAPWIQLNDDSAIIALVLLLGWLGGRLPAYSPWPLPQQADVDLLDLGDLYAIGRSGLRSALYVFVFLSLGSLFYLDPRLSLWAALSIFALGIVLALRSLLRPARRVRRLIRAVKREELDQLKDRVRQARDDAVKGDVSTQGRLTDLLAYKTQVELTREWSFDSSTLYRFGLYLLIPVVSMVGGALVERVVDLVLD